MLWTINHSWDVVVCTGDWVEIDGCSVSCTCDVPSPRTILATSTMGVIEACGTTSSPVVIPYLATILSSCDSFILASNFFINSSLPIVGVEASSLIGVFFLDYDLVLLTYSLVVFDWGLHVTLFFFFSLETLGWSLRLSHYLVLLTTFSETLSISTFSFLNHLIKERIHWPIIASS